MLKLQPRQAGIEAIACKQRRMIALLDDASVIHHDDTIGRAHRRQPMGDDDGCAPLHQCRQCVLHQPFGSGVQRRGRLVQQQDGRIAQQGARNGDPLALATGQARTAFAQETVQPLW